MPAAPTPVAIDTNVLFSALLRDRSRFSEIILRSSKLGEADLTHLYHVLLRRLNLFREEQIDPERWNRAYALCREVDETDTPHVALTLQIAGVLWTGDNTLREGLEARGFTSFFTPA